MHTLLGLLGLETEPPMLLSLEDHSLEIPAFLLRNSDGTLKYPKLAVAAVTATETPKDAEWSPPPLPRVGDLTTRDREVIRRLLDRSETASLLKQRERNTAKSEQKRLDKERHNKHKTVQREVFLKHFKWSVPL